MNTWEIALFGNPNVGKSTVFNALTGLRQHTGNWTGKTVAAAHGIARFPDEQWRLTDLPGTYSLFSGSPEEELACDHLCFEKADAVIVLCDATCLERSLSLALQVIEATPHAVVCVNLLDEARRRGIQLDLAALEARVGVPVAGISARNAEGFDSLRAAVHRAITNESATMLHLPAETEQALRQLLPLLADCPSPRFAAMRLLATQGAFARRLAEHTGIADLASASSVAATVSSVAEQIVTSAYDSASAICRGIHCSCERIGMDPRQLRLDRLLTDKRTGVPCMLALLALVFYLTIVGANVPSALLSQAFAALQPVLEEALAALGTAQWLRGMLIDGVYRVTTWVVAVMLPPMAIFFPLFTLLEDFGFLPRVAFNLDRCFKRCHACGKQALCMCVRPLGYRTARTQKGRTPKHAPFESVDY